MPIDRAAVDALFARARRDVDDGVLPAVQLALGYEGEVVEAATYGAPSDARFVTFSVTKAFTGGLAWLLMSDGALRDSTRVADVVAEFAANDKGAVTLAHLLTHTAGFPRAPMRPEEGADREQRRKRLASWRLDWTPGTQTEYHPTSAYWALVEVIEEVTSSDFRQVFAERIASPLGIVGLTLGVPIGAQADVVRVESVGEVEAGKETFGDRVKETGGGFLLRFNEPEVLASGVPGAGAVGTAADVATYYQALLHNPGGLWDAAVLEDATRNVRNTLVDPLFGCPANRTLGLVVAGDDDKAAVRGFGAHTGPRAFGALGVGGQIAWADPDSGLSFSYLTSGLDVDVVASFVRSAKIAGLAARCAPQ
ncbi:MAG TPA: serine hydrolase domain-containing protein [Mycobacteriales bacterium]|nr:serine hydrolase domain-containing protein [Mycobacteriales bacterium]